MTRPTSLLNLLCGVLLLSLSSFPMPAQNSDYRPGTIDPSGNPGNLTLFRDEQIYSVGLPSATGAPWRSATVSFDKDVNPTSSVSPLPWSSDIPFQQVNVRAAVGHILHPDKEDIFLVQRSGANHSTLVGRFSDDSGTTSIASIIDRVTGYSDFFSVSAGDLDKLYDADGNFHDEVVVAWVESGPFTATPRLGVLNCNSKDPSNPSLTSISVDASDRPYSGSDLGTYNYFIQNNPNHMFSPFPQPVDNILATAVGDFDGDGQNEIALAYLRRAQGIAEPAITIVLYRYLNNGTSASLTALNSYDLTIPASSIPNSSMVATVSLAAGDFDGSGADQLLVGGAAWWGQIDGPSSYKRGTLVSKPVAFLLTVGQTQGSITAAASSGANNSSTDFSVTLGSGIYVPRTVTISGAAGTWAPINGTWDVSPNGSGFTLDIDSSSFGTFAGQTVTVTTAAPLKQADFISLEPIPGTTSGEIQVDDDDVDAYIRVQTVPGLFHYDPSNNFDYRRREIAMAWNARPAPSRYPSLAQTSDTHLAILQVTKDDKIQVAYTGNGLMGNFQLFQTLSMGAGALRGDNDTNDPTWSLYFTGVGIDFVGSNVARGMTAAVWKVSPVAGDSAKLNPEFVCSDKANSNETTPEFTGAPTPLCPIWVDSETSVWPGDLGPRGNLNYLRLPAVAADLKGNSLRLGAPVHAQVFNPAKMDYILEQPPQHSAWLDLGNGPAVVTVNRWPNDFYTSMTDSKSTQLTTNDKDHLDWNVGGSASVSASETIKGGVDLGEDLSASVSQTVDFSAKVSYDRNQQSDSYSSGYDSQTIGQGAQTGKDDYLVLEGQILDIWRYRLYGSGLNTGNPNYPNTFYEIVLPGPSLASKIGGLDTDWYQPIHEVGNILSYPDSTKVCNPPDLGAITLPTNPPTTVAQPLISCQQVFFNGNSTTLSLSLDHQNGNGTTTDFTNQLHADLDLSYTTKTKVNISGTGEMSKYSADVDVHGGADWGHLHTSDGATSSATGITINSKQGDNQYAYPFFPILYHAEGGGLKVSYGVGDLSSSAGGGLFWRNFYAQKPDPALNLPHRFDATYNANGGVSGWAPDNTILRKLMKGFAVKRATPNPLTNEYPLLGRNPAEAETVLLDIRVYNYSISPNQTSPFRVKIYTIPYDSDTDNEICPSIPSTGAGGRVCPASVRTFVGTASTAPQGGVQNFQLTARQEADAYFLWTIKNMGPTGSGVKDYRVYVVLDTGTDPSVELNPAEPACTQIPCEDNAGNEGAQGTFSTVDPGQNNEGWTLLSVGPPNPTLLGGRQKDGLGIVTQTALSAGPPASNAIAATASIAANDYHRPKKPKKNGKLIAYLHQPLHLRIDTFSKAESRIWEHALVYDLGASQKYPTLSRLAKSSAIAGKFVRGIRPEGSSVWFDWTPQKKGLHHLYAVVQNPEGTQAAGELYVLVRRAPGDLNGDGRVDRHDLNMLNRDLGKRVADSACDESCDLDGDGKITAKDLDLLSLACDSADCSFRSREYVGGASAEEPDMRQVRRTEQVSLASFRQSAGEAGDVASDRAESSEAQLFQAERQRKQSVRSIKYYYRGQPVTQGGFGQGNVAVPKR